MRPFAFLLAGVAVAIGACHQPDEVPVRPRPTNPVNSALSFEVAEDVLDASIAPEAGLVLDAALMPDAGGPVRR